MRRLIAVPVLIALLAVPAPPASAAPGQPPPTRVSGASPLEPGCGGSPRTGTVYPDSEVGPSVAVDPRRPHRRAVTWMQDRWDNSSADAAPAAYTRDGGRIWARSVPPAFTRCTGGTYQRTSNPQLSAGPDGRMYLAAYATDDVTLPRTAMLVSTSTDGGRTWSRPRLILDLPGADVTSFAVEIAHLPGGRQVAGMTIIEGERYSAAAMTSADGGRTWSAPAVIAPIDLAEVTDPRYGAAVRPGDFRVDLAADPRPGRRTVHAVWTDDRTGAARVLHSRSTDGGRTWSRPRPVSAVPDADAFTPAVAVNARGTVGVTYVDLSADTVASPTLDADHWFTSSADGGRSWAARTRLTPDPFDLRRAPVAFGYFLGDAMGLATAGRRFVPAFAATGPAATGPTDVFVGEVRRS